MARMNDDILTVSLPALIHRIGSNNLKQTRVIALALKCELKRVRRSRNWQLIGTVSDLSGLSNELSQPNNNDLHWLINKINQVINHYSHQASPPFEQLTQLIHSRPDITLAELMALTDCSLAEVRTARFDAEHPEL
jgi:hypothetical protein